MNESVIFHAAVKLPKEQRAEFLDAACAGNPQLRADVEGLLHEHEASGSFLNRPAAQHHAGQPPATDIFRPITEGPGTIIGPYKLLQQIGEGGFGVVYMAEQQRPVRRKVALKIIKPGMDTREVIARFESERQALALMDHPNIARVLDAGATESGRPYFVMELVKGVPITEYCDKNALPTDKRLELFITVCHAVQHAHQKGVIHRDIKPSNVMVTLHDGHPVPKVIDFGVSKATSQQLTERTLFTAYGQMIGTPAYMSPEQAEMSGLDIDTRSDLYSLGVLLYELLTGTTPFDGKRLREAGYLEMQRIIREEAPPRPSTRVSTLGEALTVLSNQRSTDPKKLGQQLRGDLDVIVMKALEKERNRRYDTPNAFADDIQRFLNHEAIVARPASAAYRLRKFAERNKAAVAAGTAIAAALLLGTTISTGLAIRAERSNRLAQSERSKAEASLAEAVAAKSQVERERDRAEKAKAEESIQRQRAEEQRLAAEAAEKTAAAERTVAVQERDKATAITAELARQKEQQRRMLYVAQMNLIQTAWNDDDVARVQELLNATRPRPGETDLRSLEWHYWQRMLHPEERSIRLPVRLTGGQRGRSSSRRDFTAAPTSSSSLLSHDGTRLATITSKRSGDQFTDELQVWNTETGEIEPIFSRTLPRPPDAGSRGRGGSAGTTPTLSIVFLDSSRVVVSRSKTDNTSLREFSERMRNAAPEQRAQLLQALPLVARQAQQSDLQTFWLNPPAAADSQAAIPFALRGPWILNRDGSRIATTSTGMNSDDAPQTTLALLDGRTGATLDQFPIDLPNLVVGALSDDGQRVFLAEQPAVPSQSGFRGAPARPNSAPNSAPPRHTVIFNVATHVTVFLEPQPDSLAALRALAGPSTLSIMAFTANGKQLVVTGGQPSPLPPLMLVFDAETGRELPRSSNAVASDFTGISARSLLAFSPDGRWLVSNFGEQDKNLLALWDVTTGKQGPQFKGHAAAPAHAAFSADGSRLITADASGVVKVWPITPAVPENPPTAVDSREEFFRRATQAWNVDSPDRQWKAAAPRLRGGFAPTGFASQPPAPDEPLELRLEDTTGKLPPRRIPLPGAAASLVFSPDSRLVAAVTVSTAAKLETASQLHVWIVATGESLPLPASSFRAVERPVSGRGTPPGSRVPEASADNNRTFVGTAPVFSPDGRRLAIDTTFINATTSPMVVELVHLWDLEQRRKLPILLPSPPPGSRWGSQAARFSPDSSLLLITARGPQGPGGFSSRSASPTEGLHILSAITGEYLWGDDSSLASPTYSADGQRLAAIQSSGAGFSPSSMVLWNARTGAKLAEFDLPTNRQYTQLALSPSGDRVAVQNANSAIVYDTATQKVLSTLDNVDGRIAFGSDGQRLVTAGFSRTASARESFPAPFARLGERDAKVWDAVTGQELLTVPPESPLFAAFATGQAAQGFAPLSPQVEAESVVDWLLAADTDGQFLTRREIAARLEADASLSRETRAIALRLTASRQRSASTLATAAIQLIHAQGQPREQYQRALEWLEEALEQTPDDAILTSRQGAAQYRLGDYLSAQAKLDRSIQIRTAAKQPPLPDTLAFLAMTHHQLGHAEEARRLFVQTQRELEYLNRRNAQGSPFENRGGLGDSEVVLPWGSSTSPSSLESLTEAAALLGLPTTAELIAQGTALRDQQKFDEALAKFDAAIELDGENPTLFLERARVWRLKSNLDRALADCDAAIRLESKSAEAYNLRGLVWMGLRNAENALSDYNTAIEIVPLNPTFLVNRASAHRRLGDLPSALADYNQAIKTTSGRAATHFRSRADMWYGENELALAVRDFTEAIRLDPSFAANYNDRGICYLRMGNVEAAIQDFQEAYRRDSQAAYILTNLAAAKFLSGQTAEALTHIEQATLNAPKLAAIRFWRGYILEKQGQTVKAQAEYDGFLALSPSKTAGLFDRANRWSYRKEYDKAIADYTALLALEPNHLAGLCNRSQAFFAKGQFESALRDSEEAIKAAPNRPDGYQALAWLRATCPEEKFRDPEAAVAAATKANELTGGKHWKYLDTLAAAHAAAGNFSEAVKHEEAALALLAGLEKPEYQERLELYKSGKAYRAL